MITDAQLDKYLAGMYKWRKESWNGRFDETPEVNGWPSAEEEFQVMDELKQWRKLGRWIVEPLESGDNLVAFAETVISQARQLLASIEGKE